MNIDLYKCSDNNILLKKKQYKYYYKMKLASERSGRSILQ